MIRQLMIQLILKGRLLTTETRAKELRSYIERLVTYAKEEDLHHFRLILSKLGNHKEATRKLWEEIAPKMKDRRGGYVRVLKVVPRSGDSAPMALIEWVGTR
jgi:large subunit ribosomal protein L17